MGAGSPANGRCDPASPRRGTPGDFTGEAAVTEAGSGGERSVLPPLLTVSVPAAHRAPAAARCACARCSLCSRRCSPYP